MSGLDLGVIGNCAIASLVDRNGRHVWHGLGRLDGDPVFNALLGGDEPHSGFMDAMVTGAKGLGRQRYLPNTAILETTVYGAGGTVRIVDFALGFAGSAACSARPCWYGDWSRCRAGRASRSECGRPSPMAP